MTQHDYFAPHGLRVRGTVLVVPGRGETPHSYGRFASRLAADAYRVRVLQAPEIHSDDAQSIEGSLDSLGEQITGAIAELESAGPLAHPLVLVGSDSGAAAIAALLTRAESTLAWWPQAVVLAGLPGYSAHESADWDDELAGRTSCPSHRSVLSEDEQVQRGTLDDALPASLLDTVYGSTVELPHLLLVGDSDPYADREALSRAAKALPQARLSVVRGGHHDVLNDLQHRSVAAEVVTFLEALRDEFSLVPIVTVEASAW
ncbi:Lysophospholipase, alpha-beta hydrolase superfamily [Frankineae bacterium MT45]|nr:Lysophospholipase, alpha-beta hydrolase superfamily [Frankineae bacterium MT45]